MNARWLCGLTVAGLVGAGAVRAEDDTASVMIGPKALIELAMTEDGDASSETNSAAVQARITLRQDLKNFRIAATNMTPRDSASTWLGLLDRFWALPMDPEGDLYGYESFSYDLMDIDYMKVVTGEGGAVAMRSPITVQEVLAALPGPVAWTDLNTLVDGRTSDEDRATREGALKVLARFLDGDPVGVEEAIRQLNRSFRESRSRSRFMHSRGDAEQLNRAWRETKGFASPDDVVRQFREALGMTRGGDQRTMDVEVPPLLDLTSAEEADELLLKALLTPGIRLKARVHGQTLSRMKALAMENMATLPAPPWWLVTEPSDAALFEAIEKQFPGESQKDSDDLPNAFTGSRHDRDTRQRRDAASAYALALMKDGRVDELFRRKSDGSVEDAGDRWTDYVGTYWQRQQLSRLAPTEADAARMVTELQPYALQNPERFPWSLWLSLGQMAGRDEAVIETLEKAAAMDGLSAPLEVALWDALFRACLACDRVDEAVVALRQKLAVDISRIPPDEQRNLSRWQNPVETLLRLGRLLDRKDLIDEGIRVDAEPVVEDPEWSIYIGDWESASVLDELIRGGRYVEAEQTLLRTLTQMYKAARAESPLVPGLVRIQMGEVMGGLLVLYEKAGRQADALWLLDESPWWPTADLADTESVVPAAARVLIRAGRQMEAERLLKAYLLGSPSDDEGYEALLSLGGTNLVSWLDALYARDRFEERPLIWKAAALLQEGALDEAERVVRQALKVDPTDGEQAPGQRVKAYAVLGDILEAKGHAKDAAFFRDVVRSVRVAEEGDALYEAGLISRSLKKYEEAESLFADAYCVQWRLAERLWELGRIEEANTHYAIAFERMPEQFGQVASFCFGCQGVFDKDHSRSVAEQVLTRLAETHGERPQVHFLLGQLREAQGRYAEAYRCFKRALELDPDYLDVWSQLNGLVGLLYLPKQEKDDIVFRGMELDPSLRHFGGGLDAVADMRRLWLLAAQDARHNESAGPVFELKATAQAIAREREDTSNQQRVDWMQLSYVRYRSNRPTNQSPEALLLQHQMVQALCEHLR